MSRDYKKLEELQNEMNETGDRLRELDDSDKSWEEIEKECEFLKAKQIVLAQEFVEVYNAYNDGSTARRDGSLVIL